MTTPKEAVLLMINLIFKKVSYNVKSFRGRIERMSIRSCQRHILTAATPPNSKARPLLSRHVNSDLRESNLRDAVNDHLVRKPGRIAFGANQVDNEVFP